jgi:asparagine synthase (glutamine-hydrolysing)
MPVDRGALRLADTEGVAMKTIAVHLAGKTLASQPGDELHLRGTVFIGDVMHRTLHALLDAFPQAGDSAQAWCDVMARCGGFFSLVRCQGTRVVAAVDRVRSFPLFYGENAGAVFLGDDAEWIRQQLRDHAMDPVARDEFRLTGYVTGGDTLYPRVKQLQAGELLIVDLANDDSALRAHRYFRYSHAEPDAWDEEKLRDGFDAAATTAIRRLIEYACGRQIVIPLSGGYDSRLIATLLCRLGYRNVLAFTYGIPGNKEAAYSRQVAHSLGVPWHFVEYGNRQWRDAWNTEERRQYQRWASGWCSLPHIQDWAAVRMLRDTGLIEPDCVFAPGHTCCRRHIGVVDIPGSAGPDTPFGIDVLVERILRNHYARSTGRFGPRAEFGKWKDRIVNRLECDRVASPVELASAHEKWEWQERQTKFIGNAVRVYEFFDCRWWLPLWDTDFMRYWQGMPLALRLERRWYDAQVRRLYASCIDRSAGASLRNAEDAGLLGRSIRAALTAFPPGVKDYLKSALHRVLPARYTDSYAVSHLPATELRRLRDEGYRNDGILVHEFLRLVP